MDLPDEKPVLLYVLKFCLFLQGVGLCLWSGSISCGFWHVLAVGLGVASFFVLWALFDGLERSHVYGMNVVCAFAFWCFVGGVGGIPLPDTQAVLDVANDGIRPDVAARWAYIFGIFWSMAVVLGFSRKAVAVWYLPRRRGGYYISEE